MREFLDKLDHEIPFFSKAAILTRWIKLYEEKNGRSEEVAKLAPARYGKSTCSNPNISQKS